MPVCAVRSQMNIPGAWLCVEVLFNEILTAHRGHGFFDLASWKCERCKPERMRGASDGLESLRPMESSDLVLMGCHDSD